MEKQFKQVKALNKKYNVSLELGLCKLAEEFGELAQGVNMIIGIKNTKLTPKEIKDNIAEECADTIQNVFSIAAKSGITYEQLCNVFDAKNAEWSKKIKIKNKKQNQSKK